MTMRFVCVRGLAVLPASFATFAFVGFVITYTVAVGRHDVYPYFPTISQTGIEEPERNIFTLFLAFSSMLGTITIILRSLQLHYEADTNHQYDKKFHWINMFAMVIGLLSCFGCLMVASFQGKGWSVSGHMIGASLTFGGGIFYCWTQCYLTYRLVHFGLNKKSVLFIRGIFTILGTLTFITCIAFMKISYWDWQKVKSTNNDFQHWMPKDPGYAYHIVSSTCEWFTAIFLLLFFSTFCGDFQRIGVELKVKRRDPLFFPFYTSEADIDSPLI